MRYRAPFVLRRSGSVSVLSLIGSHRSVHVPDVHPVLLDTAAGRIGLTVYHDFHDVMDAWSQLEARGVSVNAQTAERSRLWFENVSAAKGARPAIVVGTSVSGETQFVWPFEISIRNGINCMRWIGWEHANYQMGLHTLDFARKVTADDMGLLLEHAASLSDANVALLKYQPREWDGVRNPMALLPLHPSTSLGHSVLLDRDFENLFRNRFSGKSRNTLRRKEKRLHEEGNVELRWAATPEERHPLLDTFFSQKARQFADQGIVDAFKDENIRSFYHDLAALPSGKDGTLEIAYLKVNDDVIALSCGINFRDKYESLLTSIDIGPMSRHSPGAILAKFQIEDCCNRGHNFFDMGTGDAPHKADWCDVHTELFETAIAFDEKGYMLTLPYIAKTAGKRFIKSNPMLWAIARTMRNTLYGSSSKPSDEMIKPAG